MLPISDNVCRGNLVEGSIIAPDLCLFFLFNLVPRVDHNLLTVPNSLFPLSWINKKRTVCDPSNTNEGEMPAISQRRLVHQLKEINIV